VLLLLVLLYLVLFLDAALEGLQGLRGVDVKQVD